MSERDPFDAELERLREENQRLHAKISALEAMRTALERLMTAAIGQLSTFDPVNVGDRLLSDGFDKTPEYSSWCGIIQRCTNQRGKDWPRYGGRGIRVCDEWLSFEAFLRDMGKKPGPKYSIDRINNDGNYEPSNCRWATRVEQRHNRGKASATSRFVGVHFHRNTKKWQAEITFAGKKIYLGIFETEEAANSAIQARRLQLLTPKMEVNS